MSVDVVRAGFKGKLHPLPKWKGPAKADIFVVSSGTAQFEGIGSGCVADGVGDRYGEGGRIDVRVTGRAGILAAPAPIDARGAGVTRVDIGHAGSTVRIVATRGSDG